MITTTDRYNEMRDKVNRLALLVSLDHSIEDATQMMGISRRYAFRLWRLICNEMGDQCA